MGTIIKLIFTLSLLIITNDAYVYKRSYQYQQDDDDMNEMVRRSPSQSQQSQSNYPAFPGDEYQQNNVVDYPDQDRNRYEIVPEQKPNKPRPTNSNANLNSNSNSNGGNRGSGGYGNTQQTQNGREVEGVSPNRGSGGYGNTQQTQNGKEFENVNSNRGSGGYGDTQQTQNGKEWDERQVVEYVTLGVEDKTPPIVTEKEYTATARTEEHVPWYKKVKHFAKNTYKNLLNKIKGER